MAKIELRLVPGIPFANHVDVSVEDFPRGRESEIVRRRCKVTVEYGKTDVTQLKDQGVTTLEAAMEYYEKYLYDLVKVHLSQDWEAVGGLVETMAIVQEHIAAYYRNGKDD